MDGSDAASTPLPRRPARPPSAEITPAEFDDYMKQVQQMRAETMADIVDRALAAIRRLFARAEPAPQRREPVLVEPIRPHTVRSRAA